MGSAAVTEIGIGPTCTTGYGSVAAAKKGHVIAVKMDVATSPTDNPGASSCPTGYDFAATGPVGYTTNGVHAEGLCIADRELFTGADAGQQQEPRLDPARLPGGGRLADLPAHFVRSWPGGTVDLP